MCIVLYHVTVSATVFTAIGQKMVQHTTSLKVMFLLDTQKLLIGNLAPVFNFEQHQLNMIFFVHRGYYRSGSKEYPQSMFQSKTKKKCIHMYEGCPKSSWTTWITLCKHAGKTYQDHIYFAHYTYYLQIKFK